MGPSKRLVLAVLAVAAAAAAVGAAGAAQNPPAPTTFELVARDRETRFKMVDAPPRRRESPGDIRTISARLRDSAGRPSGRLQAVFVQTSAREAQGTGTFILASGRIVIAGVEGRGNAPFAIVGGTGQYAGAGGTVTLTEARGAVRFRFSLAR